MNRQTFILIITLVVIVLLSYALLRNGGKYIGPSGETIVPTTQVSPTGEPGIGDANPTTLIGKFVCLPHKNTAGAQTEECAYGLQTHQDLFYGLNIQDLSSEQKTQFEDGQRVRVTGVLTLIKDMTAGQWENYNIQGVINVSNIILEQ